MTLLGVIPLDLDTSMSVLFDASSGGNIQAAAGRSGGNALRLSSAGISATKNIGSAVSTVNVAFGLNVSALQTGTLFAFSDAGTFQDTIKILADGTIQAFSGNVATLLGSSAVGALVSGAQQHVEVALTISATVGTIQVWVNGVSVLNLTGQNTKATSNLTASQLTWIAPGSSTYDFSDMLWANARINDRRVECLVPTGAGNYAQFTPSTGSNWQNVDEVPSNGDTDYNETVTVNNIDSFTHGAMAGAPLSIDGVFVCVRARNTATGPGSVAPFLRRATTDSPGTAVALNTSYQSFQSFYPNDPSTGSAWANAAAVNAAEIGYKKTV